MKADNKKTYKVLLQKMTPVFTLVTITATSKDGAAEKAIEAAEWFSHDRLPDDGMWSLIPAVNIFNPEEDGEPEVLTICEVVDVKKK